MGMSYIVWVCHILVWACLNKCGRILPIMDVFYQGTSWQVVGMFYQVVGMSCPSVGVSYLVSSSSEQRERLPSLWLSSKLLLLSCSSLLLSACSSCSCPRSTPTCSSAPSRRPRSSWDIEGGVRHVTG